MSTKIFRAAACLMLLSFLFTAYDNDMQEEQNKEKIDLLVQYWNHPDSVDISEALHEDFTIYRSPEFEPVTGLENFKETVREFHEMYSDWNLTIQEMIVDDDQAATVWNITATFNENGNQIDATGINVLHFRDGKIAEEWMSSNDLRWYLQMGYELTMPPADTAMPVE